MKRKLRGLVPLVGYRCSSVYYERAERIAGESHYPLKKMLAFAFDGITSLSVKPLRLITLAGMLVSAVSFVAIIVTLINAACLVTNTLLPLLLQTSLGASAFETGMAMLPAAAVGIIISPISGVVFDKFGPRAISIVGLALMTGALFLLSLSTVNTPILVVALFCMLQSAGQSLANMPVNTWGVNALKNDMIAHGNAIANTGRQVAGGLCTALIITVMTSVTASAGVDASIQVATAVGAGVAYKVCAAIGLVSLICAIFSVRTKKTAPKTKEA